MAQVLDLLRRYFQIEDHGDPRAIRAKVTGHVLTLDDALQATIPALLALLEALPADSPFLTLEALKRVLLRESQAQPLVLVFEDLHWIDSETQALLDSFVESVPTGRLLLLVNYRHEYQHGWGAKTYYTQLRLALRNALLPSGNSGRILAALREAEALVLADELRMRPLVAHCHLGLSVLYREIGRGEQACDKLSTAIELYRAMDMTFWLPEAEAARAEMSG